MTEEKRAKHNWEDAFLDALAKTGNISKSAKAARISRKRVYELRDAAPDFAEAWNEALETAVDTLEAEAWRRAARGVRKPAGWYQGVPGGYIQEYSDTLLMFLLKGNRPEKYRDNLDITSKGDKLPVIQVVKINKPDGDSD